MAMGSLKLFVLAIINILHIACAEFYSGNSTDLVDLPWSTGPLCPNGGCGFIEFCVYNFTKFAFRLPGGKCHPGRGPLLRMQAGKKYQLTINNTGNPSIQRHGVGFHTHGLHISPNGNSDNVTRVVKPGHCGTFTFDIPADHMGGTHWYYSSFHRNTQVQVHGGAFGMIVIPEPATFTNQLTADVKTWMTDKKNELLLLAGKLEQENNVFNFVNLYLGNGYEHASYNMVANSWYRLRMVGMEVGGRPGPVEFPSACTVHVVARDGVWGFQVPINAVAQSQYDIITRADFAIKCAEGVHDVNFFGGKVAELNVQVGTAPLPGSPFNGANNVQWTPSGRPAYLDDLRSFPAADVKPFIWYITDGYINSVAWNAERPHTEVAIGDVVEWTLVSTGSGPFHAQTYPMQVVTPGGCGWHKEGEYYDVISAIDGVAGLDAVNHLAEPPAGMDCKVRFRVSDYAGRVVIRSQYMEITDWGSMAWVNVTGSGRAVDTSSNLDDARCYSSGDVCIMDGTCTPEYQCNSTAGRDSCGLPCEAQSPVCSSGSVCDTIQNVCVSKLRKGRMQAIINLDNSPALGGLLGMQNAYASPTTLITLPWNTKGCPMGYDYCGVMEFCDLGDKINFGYRLPGRPCIPAHSPLIRLRPGKKFQLNLYNRATPGWGHLSQCNMHTHGIHVPGAGNSDDITREAEPGYMLRYTWDIPDDHLGGTFWYHSHVHHATKPHVAGGAFGMLIIEDPVSFAPTPQFRQWLASEVMLIASKVGDIFLGNGNPNEPLTLTTNQWHRLRIVGVDPEAKPKDLMVADQYCDCHRMQHDGVWNTVVPANVIPKNTWTMSGASRVEVAIRCSKPGKYPIYWFGGIVATLVVTDGPTNQANPWVNGQQWSTEARRPLYLQDLRTYTGPVVKYNFTIKHGYINDLPWNKEVPLATFKQKSIVEWTVKGTAGHVFHLHIWHMQVQTKGGCGYHEEGQWYDVISRSDGGDCVVRVPLYDYYDRTVIHCNYLEHEDMGTMCWVNVTDPTDPYIPLDMQFREPEPIPAIDYCAADRSPCDANALCTSDPAAGTFKCECNSGFQGTGAPGDCKPCPASTVKAMKIRIDERTSIGRASVAWNRGFLAFTVSLTGSYRFTAVQIYVGYSPPSQSAWESFPVRIEGFLPRRENNYFVDLAQIGLSCNPNVPVYIAVHVEVMTGTTNSNSAERVSAWAWNRVASVTTPVDLSFDDSTNPSSVDEPGTFKFRDDFGRYWMYTIPCGCGGQCANLDSSSYEEVSPCSNVCGDATRTLKAKEVVGQVPCEMYREVDCGYSACPKCSDNVASVSFQTNTGAIAFTSKLVWDGNINNMMYIDTDSTNNFKLQSVKVWLGKDTLPAPTSSAKALVAQILNPKGVPSSAIAMAPTKFGIDCSDSANNLDIKVKALVWVKFFEGNKAPIEVPTTASLTVHCSCDAPRTTSFSADGTSGTSSETTVLIWPTILAAVGCLVVGAAVATGINWYYVRKRMVAVDESEFDVEVTSRTPHGLFSTAVASQIISPKANQYSHLSTFDTDGVPRQPVTSPMAANMPGL